MGALKMQVLENASTCPLWGWLAVVCIYMLSVCAEAKCPPIYK